MEAPEKIYLYPSDRAGEEYEEEWGDKPWGEDSVEYTRTDAFIEKAQSFFKQSHHLFHLDGMDLHNFIEDFKKYMKGE